MAAVGGAGTGPDNTGRPRSDTLVVEEGSEGNGNSKFSLAGLTRYPSINRKVNRGVAIVGENIILGETMIDPQTYEIPDTERIATMNEVQSELNITGLAERDILFFKDNVTNNYVRVRKFDTEAGSRIGQYNATLMEANVYETISRAGDASEHILPFLTSYTGKQGAVNIIVLDFGFVKGVNFEYYLMKNPDKRNYLLIEIIKHLKWLLQNGYVHGDVKFDNFFIGENGQTYIIDFGKSKNITTSIFLIEKDINDVIAMSNSLVTPIIKSTISGPKIIRFDSADSPYDRANKATENKSIAKQYGIDIYQAISNALTTAVSTNTGSAAAASSMGGGRRRTQRHSRRQRKRNTHKSMPRIMR